MNGEFSEAQKVFSESLKRNFTAVELNTVQFHPPNQANPAEPLRINGKVILVRAGYVMIEAGAYRPFICPGSKFWGNLLSRGLDNF